MNLVVEKHGFDPDETTRVLFHRMIKQR